MKARGIACTEFSRYRAGVRSVGEVAGDGRHDLGRSCGQCPRHGPRGVVHTVRAIWHFDEDEDGRMTITRRLSAFLRMLLKRRRILPAARCLGRRPRNRSGAATASAPSRRFHGGVLGAARTDTSRRRSAATAVRLCLPRFHRTRGRLIGTHCLSSMRELAARIYLYGRRRLVMDASRGVANASGDVRPFCRLPVFRAGMGWSRRTDANNSGQRTGKGRSS